MRDIAADAEALLEERFGTRLRALRLSAARLPEEGEVAAELDRLLEEIDQFERRLSVEIETRIRPDGLVDWRAVHAALRAWDPDGD